MTEEEMELLSRYMRWRHFVRDGAMMRIEGYEDERGVSTILNGELTDAGAFAVLVVLNMDFKSDYGDFKAGEFDPYGGEWEYFHMDTSSPHVAVAMSAIKKLRTANGFKN